MERAADVWGWHELIVPAPAPSEDWRNYFPAAPFHYGAVTVLPMIR